MPMKIGDRAIGAASPPFVIAELSGNHNGSLDRALAVVDAAAAAGAHALKLQTYTADTITLDAPRPEFRIDDPASPWKGETLHSLYAKASTPYEWHARLFARAREKGLLAFSTPFDESAVDFLEEFRVPAYKIASFENTHLPLIRRAAATGRPLIVSTGMATVEEIDDAVGTARDAGCRDLVLLKCTSTYPADPANSNLRTLPDLRARWDCEVGLSDHTPGTAVAAAAVALGATVIEKHLTLARADGGVDAAFSLEPAEFAQLVRDVTDAWKAAGGVSYGPTEDEKPSLRFRRSLYVAADMRAGEVFTAQNLRVVRPGLGLPPKHYEEILGRRIRTAAPRGTPLSWDLIE